MVRSVVIFAICVVLRGCCLHLALASLCSRDIATGRRGNLALEWEHRSGVKATLAVPPLICVSSSRYLQLGASSNRAIWRKRTVHEREPGFGEKRKRGKGRGFPLAHSQSMVMLSVATRGAFRAKHTQVNIRSSTPSVERGKLEATLAGTGEGEGE